MPGMGVQSAREVKMQMRGTGQKRDETAQEADAKAKEIESFPTHLAFLLRGEWSSDLRTWKRRSNRSGVSKIDSINSRPLREFSCLAKLRSARLTSGSRANRSTPPISHRSN